MGLVILFILIGIPAVELWLLIEVGSEIGAGPTIALIILTAVLGTLLFRVQGLATLERLRAHIDRGETPVGEVVSGFGLLFAGLLLLIPGFATDALGFLLFIPPVRRWLATLLIAYIVSRGGSTIFVNLRGGQGPGPRAPGGPGDIIDGEFEDLSDRDSTGRPEDRNAGDTPPSLDRPPHDRPRD
ncbi:FxsA family protein [Thalassobaculum sp. OXR-137]|uniref:FxsA family protein n=1 Tax=Thalassobaculum sp. OXR-137 TaxID=3100173 RepID=UPI002AC9AA60|nr:FxsA family protein [Thalassobaculum sp. OXR-137]WPZ35489.1 FxsA family protein [Thalassobaculum sp. OXR-137]